MVKENPKWLDNSIQFPRLIAELEIVGAFTDEVIRDLRQSMDLSGNEIFEIIDRAQSEWDKIKQNT